jgi:regulatory protein
MIAPAIPRMMQKPPSSREPPVRKPPRPVSLAWLQRAALHYLESYASSSENLRRVLRGKLDRRCRARGEEAQPFLPLVDEVVEKAVAGGYVDDTRYAQTKVASLRRRGGSRRAIAAKLQAKGLDRDAIGAALDEIDAQAAVENDTDPDAGGDEAENAERTAAAAYARRRRLGPFRVKEREERRDRDIAAMMRAGFGYRVAQGVIDG